MSAQALDFFANSEKGASHDGVTPALAAISQKGTMVIPELPRSLGLLRESEPFGRGPRRAYYRNRCDRRTECRH